MELQIIKNMIYEFRGQKVMLDSDLAKLYEVETKQLVRQVNYHIALQNSELLCCHRCSVRKQP